MKSRLIALSVVMSLTINQTALAATMGGDTFDPSAAEAAVAKVELKTSESIQQLDTLVKSIQGFQQANAKNGNNTLIKAANLIVSSLSMATFIAHLRGEKSLETSLILVTSSVTSMLSTALDYYQSDKKINLQQVQDVLLKHQTEIANLAGLDDEQKEAALVIVRDLAQINSNIKLTASNFQQQISEGRRDLVFATVLGIGITYFIRFVPNFIKQRFADKGVEEKIVQGSKTSVLRLNQTTGITSVSDFLTFAAGFTSESSQAQLNQILASLNVTRANLQKISQK